MTEIKNIIAGVTFTHLRQINDERGAVLHMLRSDASEFIRFGECYFSEILPGAIKAWKRHHIQTQNIAVPVGRIRVVIYDNREDSSSFGCLQVIELGRPDAYFRIQIAPKLWYGFTCLGGTPALVANCADFPHDPAESEQMAIDSGYIPYTWSFHDSADNSPF